MAWTERYANFDLATGDNNGTSEANAWQTPAAVIAGVAAGNRVNIKKQASPFQTSGNLVFNVAGTATAPIWYRGYETTIGDGGRWEIDLANNLNNLQFTGTHNVVDCIKVTCKSSAHSFDVSGAMSWFLNSIFDAETSITHPSTRNMFNCLFRVGRNRVNLGGANSANSVINNCVFIRDSELGLNTGYGILELDMFARSVEVSNCLFVGDGHADVDAIHARRTASNRFLSIHDNKLYNCRHGIWIDDEPDAAREDVYINRNVFSTMGGYAIRMNAASYLGYVKHFGNYFHSCTSGFTDYPAEAGYIPEISLSASPFVDAANDNFEINDTLNGGRTARQSGISIQPPLNLTTGNVTGSYQGPSPATIATAVWNRAGRTLT
jgi:hypothetical protein